MEVNRLIGVLNHQLIDYQVTLTLDQWSGIFLGIIG